MKIPEELLRDRDCSDDSSYQKLAGETTIRIEDIFYNLGSRQVLNAYHMTRYRDVPRLHLGWLNGRDTASAVGGEDCHTVFLGEKGKAYRDVLGRAKYWWPKHCRTVNSRVFVYRPGLTHKSRGSNQRSANWWVHSRTPGEFARVIQSVCDVYEYRVDLLDKGFIPNESFLEYLFFVFILPDVVSSELKASMRRCVSFVKGARIQCVFYAYSPAQLDEQAVTHCDKLLLYDEYSSSVSLFTDSTYKVKEMLPYHKECGKMVDFKTKEIYPLVEYIFGVKPKTPKSIKTQKTALFISQYLTWVESQSESVGEQLREDGVCDPYEAEKLYTAEKPFTVFSPLTKSMKRNRKRKRKKARKAVRKLSRPAVTRQTEDSKPDLLDSLVDEEEF